MTLAKKCTVLYFKFTKKYIVLDKTTKAYQIAQEKMLEQDAFSQWLGIEIIAIGQGATTLQLTIRADMTNGFGIAHGGIAYALADSALAFASNAHGRHSVSVDTSIAHLQVAKVGDTLQAVTEEESLSHKMGVYRVVIRNQKQEKIAVFKGIVYRSSQEWQV